MKNMEKKEYIKPEIEVIAFETECLMLAMSETEVDTEQQLSNAYRPGRRGQWGNLWYVEED